MKVLLLTAPCPDTDKTPLHLGDNRPPQGLGYIAAFLEKAGHTTKIIDLYQFNRTIQDKNVGVVQEDKTQNLQIYLDDEIQSFQPDFIGMYIHTISFYKACELGEELKKKYPHIKLMCGGPHPAVLPESIPDCFDHIVVGEGEYVVLDIVEGRQKERVIKGIRVENMDELPWPDFDWFFDKPYNWKLEVFGDSSHTIMPLNTSRGCPFSCMFCGVKNVCGAGYRCISAEVLFKKVMELKEKYNVDGFYFREDNFTANSVRLEKFCNLLIENKVDLKWAGESRVKELSEPLIKKMAQSGCIGLYIGVESGSPRMLQYMRKGETVEDYLEKFPVIHGYGIKTYTTWLVGLPTETREDRHLNSILMNKLSPTSCDQFVYLGIPESDFYIQIDSEKSYEYKGSNGFIYPKGFLSLARQLYGDSDPRCQYVERLYEANKITPVEVEF